MARCRSARLGDRELVFAYLCLPIRCLPSASVIPRQEGCCEQRTSSQRGYRAAPRSREEGQWFM